MVAVDTNILVRFLTRDDVAQAKQAAELIGSSEVWVAKTVLLETEWVLRSAYDFRREQIVRALQAAAGLENVRLEDPVAVERALKWFAGGLDFADALHLASFGDAERFATFDAKLAKKAGKLTGVEILVL